MRQGMVLLCSAVLAACGSSSSSGEAFHANMSSAQEIPVPTVGTPAPTGTAVFQNNGDGTVSYTVTGSNMTVTATGVTPAITFAGMHIHLAITGQTAGVTVPLTTPTNGSSSFSVAGTFTSATCASGQTNCINTGNTIDTVLAALRNGGAYINVHTSKNPSGELRGQIATGGL
jgi:CHRD domain